MRGYLVGLIDFMNGGKVTNHPQCKILKGAFMTKLSNSLLKEIREVSAYLREYDKAFEVENGIKNYK
jgi:hypothetical protein